MFMKRLALLFLGLGLLSSPGNPLRAMNASEDSDFSWTMLAPQNDSRPPDVRIFDDHLSQSMLDSMNENEPIFHHRLTWRKQPISHLLSISAPFCELPFDAVHPQILTPKEKEIVKEYFKRGGFILLCEDAYPYPQDEFWAVKSWPIIDFITKELSASDPDFTWEKVTEKHQVFHQHLETNLPDSEKMELEGNPYSPYLIMVYYKGHPCAFVEAQFYHIEDDKWVDLPRPYVYVFDQNIEGYALTVNLYVYATLH